MTVTRADSFTPLKKKQEYFSDFLTNFDKTPVGNQLARVSNELSINQALINLIKTNVGERPFQPDIGSNVYASLFDPNDIVAEHTLEFYIENTIKMNETRVNLISVSVISPLEQKTTFFPSSTDENAMEIVIVYNLINNPDPITLRFILKRIR